MQVKVRTDVTVHEIKIWQDENNGSHNKKMPQIGNNV
jgi:hypothetical protein